ncbi:DUF4752 domain-containing protein, partial [Klebsiella oxytoca]|nr:DUF4752 domain-containing protein [Klebsiella oxytoca]ELT9975095.1 DUF4752 domain-containing protein [Klebsiella oxytoca]
MNISTVNELIQSLESAGELSIKESKYLELAKAYLDVTAENVALKQAESNLVRNIINDLGDTEFQYARVHTPATDACLAGIKADGRIEGINFAAGRLAAAFNHGFVDKSMAEVYDVVRMILTAKEDLANDPAEDGLSGEYAEKSLAEWGF